ncbi:MULTISPECIES: hypothetical protein [Streptomyces]|uniref:hypothetical protein n=1 Tax=Streptomyces lycopersici TaxID=2974589 RepID=UPI00293EF5C7|nr:hypothetical protein [Streptomyces sp. NEAU-383]
MHEHSAACTPGGYSVKGGRCRPGPGAEGCRRAHNEAHDSFVGAQDGIVFDSTINVVPPDASPQKKYEVGVRCLEEGLPGRARELIWDAITHDHDGPQIRFHWALAMLSKRAHHDLSAEERRQTKATLWAETCELAKAGQFRGDRSRRVRYYFEPDPIGARTRPPEESTAFRHRPRLAAWTGLFVVAAGFLGISAVIAEPLIAIVELLIALGTGFLAARFGQRWWHN